ncbi:MAG: hypothetical protein A3F80_00705 [Candidatus Melainabacteria bacterium RIFCSPLOWO2_12_FULL_35_11]|nr:MAG: hypothetical protein A3F80_00705 [Candidatus Melainabacteria bacterium RIFCSPLOWO2_12_FULL_35_11]
MNPFQNEKILISFPAKTKNAIQLACAFPNIYTVGMASLGFQTAWKLFNQNPALNVSRWFMDIQEKSNSAPDYIGFSFSWELDYKNIFSMLEKNNIPLRANERGTNDPIVFCGGQVPNANPGPFCENFDFFLIGDLEIVARGLTNKIIEIKNLTREEKLNELSKLPGVYVPHCMDMPWHASAKKQTTPGNLTSSSILTPDSVWPDTFIIEVVRSCPELCRFCLASYNSLPFRTPDVKDSLIPTIDFGLKHTNKIGLLGASVTQHPEFEELLEHLLSKSVEICHSKSLQVQIASVRADSVTKKTADGLLKLGSKSLTMAVETGSARLRNVINKKVSNETIIKSIETIYNSGFNSIKLYGMAGLPSETENDLNETIKLLSEIKTRNKGKKLSWGCSVFVPKAQTPFQYFGVDKGARKKLKYLSKELHKIGVDFRPESYEWSLIQALISRGDRSVNKILEDAYRYGGTLGSFKKAMKGNKNIDCDNFIFKEWDRSIKLPWENIQGHLKKEIISKHAEVLL